MNTVSNREMVFNINEKVGEDGG